MRTLGPALAFAAATPFALAQQITRVSGLPGESHRVEDCTALANGDVALAGQRYYFTPSFSQLATLSRTQPDGSPLWTLSVEVLGESSSAFGVRELEDASILMGFHAGFGASALALVRVSASGSPIWFRSYPGAASYGLGGLERDRSIAAEFAVVAGRAELPIGISGQLLRIETFNGMTIFNRAYAPDGLATTAAFFNDLDFEIDSGDYYVTGGVTRVVGPDQYESDLLVARFQRFSGGLIWCKAYSLPPRSDDSSRYEEGLGLELDSTGAVHVVARADSPLEDFGPAGALHLKLDPTNGNILASNFLPDVEPASASLDQLSSGNLIASGRRIFGDGQGQAQMWEINASNTLFPWRAEYTDGTSAGADAVEHLTPQGAFLTLCGWNYPSSISPIGSPDQLFIQTDLAGDDGCSALVWTPEPIAPIVTVTDVTLAVVNLPSGSPMQTQNSFAVLDTAVFCNTTACPADFNFDGFVDDTDFVLFAQAYDLFTVPPADAACDLNGDTFVDDTDFVLFAQAYDAFVCP